MKLSFIGAGKVGKAFGRYISDIEDVKYFYSRNIKSAKHASSYVGCQFTSDLKTVVEASDLICITTSDDAIASVVKAIEDLPLDLHQKTFMHMSGAKTSNVFDGLRQNGAAGFTLHPLQTFASYEKAANDLKQTYFAFEGDASWRPWVEKVTMNHFVLTAEQKTKYHLSACIFSNYLVSLMDYGMTVLSDIGIGPEGFEAMLPLIQATFENIRQKGTKAALTGPIQRGDVSTVTAHLSALEGQEEKLYKVLGQWTATHLLKDQDKEEMLAHLWRTNE